MGISGQSMSMVQKFHPEDNIDDMDRLIVFFLPLFFKPLCGFKLMTWVNLTPTPGFAGLFSLRHRQPLATLARCWARLRMKSNPIYGWSRVMFVCGRIANSILEHEYQCSCIYVYKSIASSYVYTVIPIYIYIYGISKNACNYYIYIYTYRIYIYIYIDIYIDR